DDLDDDDLDDLLYLDDDDDLDDLLYYLDDDDRHICLCDRE
ncbi:unnamed protein product, partial [Rotaria magnacalcarata]